MNIFGGKKDKDIKTEESRVNGNGKIPKIQTSWLSEQLNNLKNETVDLANEFDGEDMTPLFNKLVFRFTQIFNAFEERSCQMINNLKGVLLRLIQNFRPAAIIAEYRKDVEQAEDALKNAIQTAFETKLNSEAELVKLQSDEQKIARALEVQHTSMTGDLRKKVEKPNWWIAGGIAGMIAVVAIGLETLGGFDLFRFISSSLTALGSSAIVATALTTCAVMGGWGVSRVLSAFDAIKAFRVNFPNGYEGPDGKQITPRPISLSTVIQAAVFSALLGGGSLGLLLWRIGIAHSMPGAEASVGLLSATGICIMSIIGYVLEVIFGPKHEREDIQEYKRLEGELSAIQAKIADHKDKSEGYQKYIEKAVATYNNVVDQAESEIKEAPNEIKKLRTEFLALMQQYQEIWADTVRTQCKGLGEALTNAVIRLKKLDRDSVKVNEKALKSQFENILRIIPDEEFLKRVENYEPAVPPLPPVRRTEFNSLRKSIEQGVQEEIKTRSKVSYDPIQFKEWE